MNFDLYAKTVIDLKTLEAQRLEKLSLIMEREKEENYPYIDETPPCLLFCHVKLFFSKAFPLIREDKAAATEMKQLSLRIESLKSRNAELFEKIGDDDPMKELESMMENGEFTENDHDNLVEGQNEGETTVEKKETPEIVSEKGPSPWG